MNNTHSLDKDFTIKQQNEPNVCAFSKKVDYMAQGRICTLDTLSCFNWNQPLIFSNCFIMIHFLKELHEAELLEKQ
jgi:hypothetical protein